jgi:hypothetical protein
MLPKFRPATLGGDASPRPTIRPVKATPPPPPPAPPRRRASGPALRATPLPPPIEEDAEIATSPAPYADPPTMDGVAAPATVPYPVADSSFEDETRALHVDERLVAATRGEAKPRNADLDVPYDALPSLEVRRPYDTYDVDHEPETQMAARIEDVARERAPMFDPWATDPDAKARDGSGARARPEPRGYAPPLPAYDDRGSTSDAQYVYESDSRNLRSETGWSDEPQAYEPPRPPPAAAVPYHPSPAFPRGVQPLTTAQGSPPAPPGGFGAPRHPPYGGGYGHPAFPMSQPTAAAPMRQGGMPYPGHAHPAPMGYPGHPGMAHAAPPRMHPGHPGMAQPGVRQGAIPTATTTPRSPMARFAWFVAGATFGIFFAFFATGFVPRLTANEEPLFPPAPPPRAELPVAPPAAAPPPAVEPNPVASAVAVQSLPSMAPTDPQPVVDRTPPPVAKASPPPTSTISQPARKTSAPSRAVAAKRPAAPAPATTTQAPKQIGTRVEASDDEPQSRSRVAGGGAPSAPAAPPGAGDMAGMKDLLSQALAP